MQPLSKLLSNLNLHSGKGNLFIRSKNIEREEIEGGDCDEGEPVIEGILVKSSCFRGGIWVGFVAGGEGKGRIKTQQS
ncbi:unnamed protein product [Linum trigynum]|uniref:Uncharacterized protein n=1 Tax=Linum trigynum TaxID=586398 RepID=A0AAV2FVQ3_9ROSI